MPPLLATTATGRCCSFKTCFVHISHLFRLGDCIIVVSLKPVFVSIFLICSDWVIVSLFSFKFLFFCQLSYSETTAMPFDLSIVASGLKTGRPFKSILILKETSDGCVATNPYFHIAFN